MPFSPLTKPQAEGTAACCVSLGSYRKGLKGSRSCTSDQSSRGISTTWKYRNSFFFFKWFGLGFVGFGFGFLFLFFFLVFNYNTGAGSLCYAGFTVVVLKQIIQVSQFPLILKTKDLWLHVLAGKKIFPLNFVMWMEVNFKTPVSFMPDQVITSTCKSYLGLKWRWVCAHLPKCNYNSVIRREGGG